MNISLGSLLSEDLRALEELDLLPDDMRDDPNADPQLTMSGALGPGDTPAQNSVQSQENHPVTQMRRTGKTGSLTWFEDMLDGSRLGRTQTTRRGLGVSDDGSTRVEWEVSEYTDDGSEEPQTHSGSKRKIGEVAKDDDVSMQ